MQDWDGDSWIEWTHTHTYSRVLNSSFLHSHYVEVQQPTAQETLFAHTLFIVMLHYKVNVSLRFQSHIWEIGNIARPGVIIYACTVWLVPPCPRLVRPRSSGPDKEAWKCLMSLHFFETKLWVTSEIPKNNIREHAEGASQEPSESTALKRTQGLANQHSKVAYHMYISKCYSGELR